MKRIFIFLILPMLLSSCGKSNSTFVVTFDGDGGTLVSGKVEQIVKKASKIIPPVFEKKGYTYNDWSFPINQICFSTVIKPDWKLKNYNIVYHLDDGINDISNPCYYNIANENIYLKPAHKEGYSFLGWSLDNFCGGGDNFVSSINSDILNAISTNEINLFANFSASSYSITYNLDGGHFDESYPTSYSYNTETSIPNPSKTGCKFLGWGLSKYTNLPTKDYVISTGMVGNINLFAFYEKNEYVVTLDPNGGVLTESTSIKVKFDSAYNLPVPTRTGYSFEGWYNSNNEKIPNTGIWELDSNLSLYAKWIYTKYSITYVLDGGTNNSSNPTSYTIDSSKITLHEPTRTDYDFVGWTYNGQSVTEVDPAWIENITLVANWRAHTYSISYELNGGTNNQSNPTSYTIESSTITLKDATRNGYTFAGWYKTSTFSNKVTTINTGSYGDLVLYAKWTPVQYSITYNLEGGTNASSNPSTYTIESSFNFADATKTGYQFAGWFDGNGNRVTSISAGATGALTLTAHWTAKLNNLYVGSLDTSKGTVAITSGSGYSDESITVVATPVGDCVFKGWYHEFAKVSDDATYTFVMPTNDYILVAHFFTKAEEEEEKEKELHRWGVIPTLSDNGKTITYGLYPQTNVNDSSLVSALNALTTPESNGWYLYEGNYYAKISARPCYTIYKFDNGTTISYGTTYWFKCEPIVWNVLSNNNGEYYILSSVLLDAQRYHNSTSTRTIGGKTIYPNNYEYSDIRSWLNEDFYNSAFALENSHIQTISVDNGAATYACANTEDKVFLPSYMDYCYNSSYGFKTTIGPTDTRYCRTTDWARARGAYYDRSSILYNGYYWTRSPYEIYSDCAQCVADDGSLDYGKVYCSYMGVRPSLSIKIA